MPVRQSGSRYHNRRSNVWLCLPPIATQDLPRRQPARCERRPVNDPAVLDLDGNNSSLATGSDYVRSFAAGGAGVGIADAADLSIVDLDSATMQRATITLTNPQPGDALTVGTLPTGITVDPASTPTNLVLVGAQSTADYQAAVDRQFDLPIQTRSSMEPID